MEKTLVLDGLLRRRAAGLEQFLAKHRDPMRRLARSIVGNADAAEDAAQEALLQASRHWAELATMDRPDLWLRRVTIRRAVSMLETRHAAMDEVADTRDQTEALAVQHTLAKLTPDMQVLLALAVGERWSYGEIGQALEIPLGTVASRLNIAKKAFRQAWGDER